MRRARAVRAANSNIATGRSHSRFAHSTAAAVVPRGCETLSAPSEPLALANDALARGDFLAAYDIAVSALGEGGADRRLDYCATLALARMGDTQLALELYEQCGLATSDDDDLRSLRGRLKKDLAEAALPDEQPQLFAEASDAYRMVYERKGGYFPAINAATTALLAGDEAAAQALAREIFEDPDIVTPHGYYAMATAAEALLLLGRSHDAFEAMQRAVACEDADVGSRASTFRQMMLIARVVPERAEAIAPLLELLRPAPVIFFAGHMFIEDAAIEAGLVRRIEEALDELSPDIAYGALACGADILIAEAILRRGLELNIVLPFEREDFLIQSVRPGGQGWVARFETCLDQAARVSFATDMEFIGDPNLFRFGSSVAMGLAQMRAQHLRTHAVQLAILQSNDGISPAGTASDVDLWTRLGHRTRIIEPGAIDRRLDRPPELARSGEASRVEHSIIFADFAGFSALSEAVLPVFASSILGRIGAVLDRYGDAVLYRNSWGDALYAVVSTPSVAAELVLDLQRELRDMPQELKNCTDHCGMRIGVHHGPIYRAWDAVMQRPSFFGTEVTRTARIEPVTPTGEVYATEAFAAMLALEPEQTFGTHYVGRIKLAKGYGELAMYKLSRLAAPSCK